MTDRPDINVIRVEEGTANGYSDRATALAFVRDCVATVWNNARLTAREAIAAVEGPGDPRPEVHLHEAQQWVSVAQLWHDNLVHSREYQDAQVRLYALSAVMISPEGQEALRSAARGLKAAQDALAWAREKTGVSA